MKIRVTAAAAAAGLILAGCGSDTSEDGPPPPVEMTETGFIYGDADQTLTIYEDLRCPFCAELHSELADDIETWTRNGDVEVDFVVSSVLADAPDAFSYQAGNVVLGYAEHSPDQVTDAMTLIFNEQDHSGTVEELLDTVEADVGELPDEARQSISAFEYSPVQDAASQQLVNNDVPHVPWTELNGEPVGDASASVPDMADEIRAMIDGS